MICANCKQDKPAIEISKSKGPWGGTWCKRCQCDRSSINKHGITIGQKGEIANDQGGCAICGHEDPGSKGWVVDHDHKCCPGEKSCPKCRRGILCGWCNKMLAYAFDRPQILESAIGYLKSHASNPCSWHMPLACAPRICGKE